MYGLSIVLLALGIGIANSQGSIVAAVLPVVAKSMQMILGEKVNISSFGVIKLWGISFLFPLIYMGFYGWPVMR